MPPGSPASPGGAPIIVHPVSARPAFVGAIKGRVRDPPPVDDETRLEAFLADCDDAAGEGINPWPNETESVYHSVLPILGMAEWDSRHLAFEWRNIDVTGFGSRDRSRQNCTLLVEVKRFQGSDRRWLVNAVKQAHRYGSEIGLQPAILVTDGVTYSIQEALDSPVCYDVRKQNDRARLVDALAVISSRRTKSDVSAFHDDVLWLLEQGGPLSIAEVGALLGEGRRLSHAWSFTKRELELALRQRGVTSVRGAFDTSEGHDSHRFQTYVRRLKVHAGDELPEEDLHAWVRKDFDATNAEFSAAKR